MFDNSTTADNSPRKDHDIENKPTLTSVEIGYPSVPPIFTMRVNHPFLIVIYEAQPQSMLFMGKIGDPS